MADSKDDHDGPRDPDRFYCPYPGCKRSFAELWRLKVHYRAPPDIRGSGKERGHGTELAFCPKCNKALKPGKHHVGCSAGKTAPRHSTKRSRLTQGQGDGDGDTGDADTSGDRPATAQLQHQQATQQQQQQAQLQPLQRPLTASASSTPGVPNGYSQPGAPPYAPHPHPYGQQPAHYPPTPGGVHMPPVPLPPGMAPPGAVTTGHMGPPPPAHMAPQLSAPGAPPSFMQPPPPGAPSYAPLPPHHHHHPLHHHPQAHHPHAPPYHPLPGSYPLPYVQHGAQAHPGMPYHPLAAPGAVQGLPGLPGAPHMAAHMQPHHHTTAPPLQHAPPLGHGAPPPPGSMPPPPPVHMSHGHHQPLAQQQHGAVAHAPPPPPPHAQMEAGGSAGTPTWFRSSIYAGVFDDIDLADLDRVPSPPPLPEDFPTTALGGGTLFNFAQFSHPMPRAAPPPPPAQPAATVAAASPAADAAAPPGGAAGSAAAEDARAAPRGEAASLSAAVADLWPSDALIEHNSDGDIMQLLFGEADRPPTMATIHLHQFLDGMDGEHGAVGMGLPSLHHAGAYVPAHGQQPQQQQYQGVAPPAFQAQAPAPPVQQQHHQQQQPAHAQPPPPAQQQQPQPHAQQPAVEHLPLQQQQVLLPCKEAASPAAEPSTAPANGFVRIKQEPGESPPPLLEPPPHAPQHASPHAPPVAAACEAGAGGPTPKAEPTDADSGAWGGGAAAAAGMLAPRRTGLHVGWALPDAGDGGGGGRAAAAGGEACAGGGFVAGTPSSCSEQALGAVGSEAKCGAAQHQLHNSSSESHEGACAQLNGIDPEVLSLLA